MNNYISPPLGSLVCREDYILVLSRGRRVLHLGCIGFERCDPTQRVELYKASLHEKIKQIAETVVGVDLSIDVITQLTKMGIEHKIVHADVEDLPDEIMRNEFDVIIAGDIIEHISNLGSFLEGIKAAMQRDTIIVITTPNAFGAFRHIRYCLGTFSENHEHVVCFNYWNLRNLICRHGYELIEWRPCYQANAKKSILFIFGRLFLSYFGKNSGTILAVIRLTGNNVLDGVADAGCGSILSDEEARSS